MADDIQNDVAQPSDDSTSQQSDSISFGGQTYTQDELNKLIGLGKIGLEAEKNYNTRLDRVWPDYTKTKNDYRSLEERYKALETQYKQPQQQQQAPQTQYSEDQIREAKQVLRNMGVVTSDDFDSMLEARLESKLTQREFTQNLLKESGDLEKKYDGADGRPKFDTVEVLTYMRDNGVSKPETAYKLMYEDQLDAWREQNINKAKKPGLVTGTTTGAKTPPKSPKITDDNVSEMLREVLQEG